MFNFGSYFLPGTAKLLEEMGELQQVLGKTLQLGTTGDHWDGTNLGERLLEELADVQAALSFFIYTAKLNTLDISNRALAKLEKFQEWHENNKKENT